MATTHQRQLIREAAVAQIKGSAPTYATSAQDRVFETRLVPFASVVLPAIAVYTLRETSVDKGSAPRELERTMQLAVEAMVKTGENVDDAMDAIALEIERAMHADPTFGDTAGDSSLTSTEMDIVEDADREYGVVRMLFTTTYYTGAPDADDVQLDDLQTVDIKTSLGNAVNPDNQAEDQLTNLSPQQF
jgi:hypothetical protein